MKSSRSNLIEDCKDILTEGIFNHRWELVKCYHALGLRLLEEKDPQEAASYVTEEIPHLRLRTVQRTIQFARKFPNLDKLPEGKAISWNKICNLYLPEPKTGIWSWRLLSVEDMNADFLTPNRSMIAESVRELGKKAEKLVGGIEVFREI